MDAQAGEMQAAKTCAKVWRERLAVSFLTICVLHSICLGTFVQTSAFSPCFDDLAFPPPLFFGLSMWALDYVFLFSPPADIPFVSRLVAAISMIVNLGFSCLIERLLFCGFFCNKTVSFFASMV